MTVLSAPHEFRLVLEFAVGIADRGLPLAVVRLAPADDTPVPSGPALDDLRATMAYLCRKTDRVTMAGPGHFDVLLVDCNRQGALIFAHRVLEGLGEWEGRTGLAIGCGIACFAPNLATADALISAADVARRRSFAAENRIAIHGG